MINSIDNYNDVMGQGNAREPHPNGSGSSWTNSITNVPALDAAARGYSGKEGADPTCGYVGKC
jgi:hypothetical protein